MSEVIVFYNRDLKIQSIVAVPSEPGAPPAGVLPIEGCQSVTIALTDAQADVPLIELHTRFRLELGDEPRLISVDEDRRRWRSEAEKRQAGVVGVRFEATVHPGRKQVALEEVSDLDLDRVPDPEGGVRLLVTAEEATALVERGYEVHLVNTLPVRPLDPALGMDDASAKAWIEEQVRGIERQERS